MEFASPGYGWLAIPIAALLLIEYERQRRKGAALQRFAKPHLVGRLLPAEARWRQAMRCFSPFLVMLLLMLTLMRPHWGAIEDQQTTTGLDIVIALDVSKSMLADDQPPSRLVNASKAVERLLDKLTGDRVGLIAFAGSAFQLCPLTSDYAIVRQLLEEFGPDTMPQGGSSIASALSEARRAFRGTPPESRVLIVVSDGEDHAGGIEVEMEKLRNQGVAVFAVLAGTAAGGVMPLPGGRFVRDREGLVVMSRASLATLERIDPAPAVIAADGSGLAGLLERARAEATATARKERRWRLAERYQLPLALALLFWGAELMFRHGRHPA